MIAGAATAAHLCTETTQASRAVESRVDSKADKFTVGGVRRDSAIDAPSPFPPSPATPLTTHQTTRHFCLLPHAKGTRRLVWQTGHHYTSTHLTHTHVFARVQVERPRRSSKDYSHYLDFDTGAGALLRTARPGSDRIGSSEPKRSCLFFALISAYHSTPLAHTNPAADPAADCSVRALLKCFFSSVPCASPFASALLPSPLDVIHHLSTHDPPTHAKNLPDCPQDLELVSTLPGQPKYPTEQLGARADPAAVAVCTAGPAS